MLELSHDGNERTALHGGAQADQLDRRGAGEARARRRLHTARVAPDRQPIGRRRARGAQQVSAGRLHLHGGARRIGLTVRSQCTRTPLLQGLPHWADCLLIVHSYTTPPPPPPPGLLPPAVEGLTTRRALFSSTASRHICGFVPVPETTHVIESSKLDTSKVRK